MLQPGSSGRDVDIRRQEAVDVADDGKWKSSATTRASPALAHGADEGYTVAKQPSDVATNNDTDVAASECQNPIAGMAADSRPSAMNSFNSVRSLKHKNDRSYKYGTGSADFHRANSLQDLTDGGGHGGETSCRPSTENVVSCGVVENETASGVCHLHGVLSQLSDACCSVDSTCTRHDTSTTAHAGERLPGRSRSHVRCRTTNPELELVNNTGIVSNTAQFWEDLVLDSGSSAVQCRVRSRHVSEDRHRCMRRHFLRRDASSPRYSTLGAPCDVEALHGVLSVARTTSDIFSQSECLHANSDIEVCCLEFYYAFILCLERDPNSIRQHRASFLTW